MSEIHVIGDPHMSAEDLLKEQIKIRDEKFKSLEQENQELKEKLSALEDSPEMPCGHIDTFLTIDERGLHCSKCERIYTDWLGMPDKITKLTSDLKTSVDALGIVLEVIEAPSASTIGKLRDIARQRKACIEALAKIKEDKIQP